MVKRGTKRKIEIKKITNKNSLATSFTKRSHGLYSKASQLCLLSDAQIAILATPSSSNSNVPFFSFGHSSVEAVVSAFLSGESLAPLSIMETKEMREDLGVCMARSELGLGHWWDDDERFKKPEEIMEAIESMKSLLSHVRALLSHPNQNPNRREAPLVVDDDSKNNKSNHHGTDETLVNLSDIAEHDQIPSTSDSLCNKNDLSAGDLDEWSDMDLDQLLIDFDDENQTTQEEDDHQISENSCSDNNAPLLPEAGNLEETDLDFETIFEGLLTDEELDEFATSLLTSG